MGLTTVTANPFSLGLGVGNINLFHLNSEDFWVEGKRRGISVAYMGAYIYLMGVLGKTEIDLKYLDNKKILNDFSAGYPIWKARKTIKSLVLTFASRKVFGYGKRLEALNDFVLHVKQKSQKTGNQSSLISVSGF